MPSIKGEVTLECPHDCGPFSAAVWTLVRADTDPDIKETIIGGELNLVACRSCGRLFYADIPVIYMEPEFELLAFVFPESMRAQEAQWRAKMEDDFKSIKDTFLRELKIDFPPAVMFGFDTLKEALEAERDAADERDVISAAAVQLGFSVRKIKPSFARSAQLPYCLPYDGNLCNGKNAAEACRQMMSANIGPASIKALADFLASGQFPFLI